MLIYVQILRRLRLEFNYLMANIYTLGESEKHRKLNKAKSSVSSFIYKHQPDCAIIENFLMNQTSAAPTTTLRVLVMKS